MSAKLLRIIGAVMLTVAVIFLIYALTHPEAGSVFYLGSLRIGSELWRIFYIFYAVVTAGLFVTASVMTRRSK